MSKLPYMQFYPADWLQDTQILSLEAQGAWMKILCALHIASERGRKTWSTWELKQFLGLPEGDRALRLVGILCSVADISARDEDGNHAESFDYAVEITITSRRMVRDEANRIAELERKRRYEDKNPTRHRHSSDANTTRRVQSSDIRDQRSERIKKERDAPPNGGAGSPLLPGVPSGTGKKKKVKTEPPEFTEAYAAYPIHNDRADALKAWNDIPPHEFPSLATILAAIAKQKRWRENAQPGEFRPHWKNFATWLRRRCWNDVCDEPEEKQPTGPEIKAWTDDTVTIGNGTTMKKEEYYERYKISVAVPPGSGRLVGGQMVQTSPPSRSADRVVPHS